MSELTLEQANAEIAKLKDQVSRLSKALGEMGGGISSVSVSAGKLLGPFGSLFDATAKGATGVSAYNNALDLSGEELKKLVGASSLFGVAIGAMSDSAKLYVKMAGAQADALMQSYQSLASVGAAGKADLVDVYETMRKFGATSKDELPKFTQMLGQNSEMLAKLGGTVSQGMKQFADVSASIQQTGLQTEFMNMGMSVDSINKGIAGYLKIQTQTGQAQKMTQEELNAGAADYLKQLDNLSKLTGKSAEALQKEREERLNDEKFAIMRRQQQQVVARGGAEGAAMAETIKQQDELLSRIKAAGGAEAEKAAMYTMGGFGSQTEEGRKMLMQMPEVVKMIQDVSAGAKINNDEIMKTAGESTTRFIDQMGNNVLAGGKNIGFNMSQSMGFENTAAGEEKRKAAQIAAGQKPTTASEDAKAQQDAQTKATGESVSAMVELAQKQRQAAIDLSDMSVKGIVPVTNFMGTLAGKLRDVTEILPGTRPRTSAELNQQAGGLKLGDPGFQDVPYPGKKSTEVERKAQEDVAEFVGEVNKSLGKAAAGFEKIGEAGLKMIKDMISEMSTGRIPGERAAEERSRPAATAPATPATPADGRTVPNGNVPATPAAPAGGRTVPNGNVPATPAGGRTVPNGNVPATPAAPAGGRTVPNGNVPATPAAPAGGRTVPNGNVPVTRSFQGSEPPMIAPEKREPSAGTRSTIETLTANISQGFINVNSANNIRFPEMPTSYKSSLDPDMMSKVAGLSTVRETKPEPVSMTPRDSELIASNALVSQKLDDLIDIMRRGVGYQRKISQVANA
jgi:hypothetical protein